MYIYIYYDRSLSRLPDYICMWLYKFQAAATSRGPWFGNHCSTVTALHTLNSTVENGFNQMAPPAQIITVALDMSKAFDTINIHTLIRRLLQTKMPGTIREFIANYIKGRKTYTTYRNHTAIHRQSKTGVPKGGVLSPTLFNIYTADLPPPVHHHIYTQARVKQRNTYTHTVSFLDKTISH